MLNEILISLLIVAGAVLVLISAIGLVRLPDFLSRLHAPTKAATLGVGCLLLASLLYFSTRHAGLSLHELLIIAFLFLTAPISAQLLAQAGLRDGWGDDTQTPNPGCHDRRTTPEKPGLHQGNRLY